MSDYKFKGLNEVDYVEEVSENATIMGFENGVPIQMPMSAVKGSGGVFVIDSTSDEYAARDEAYGDKLKEALLNGYTVWYYNGYRFFLIIGFSVDRYCGGTYFLSAAYANYPSGTGYQYVSCLVTSL